MDWSHARSQMMLDSTVVNLNTGSFGPTPLPVFERVTELRRQQAAEPMDFIVRTTPPLLWNARERLAEFLGTSAERLVFTQNVSTAINIIASGLALNGPGEILMSDREYGAMRYCWERAARRQGLELRLFPLPLMGTPPEILDSVERAITPRTKLLFFSHVYSANGLIMPASELCELARQCGITSVVDGAHAPAMIPLDVDAVDADFYAGNCHKWLLAPIGAGFLVLGKNSLDRLEPLQVSWGYGAEPTDERDEFGSTPRLRALELEGTRDICPWLAVPDAIDFQAGLGWDAIRSRIAELTDFVRQQLDGRCGLRLTTPPAGSMTAFWAPTELPADEVRRRLWSHRIEIPVTDWPDGRIVRVSTHFYTTEAEVMRLAEVAGDLFK